MEKNQKIIRQSDENCPVRKSLALLGGKWTLLILFQINERVIRYGELKRAIPGISEKVLIQELNSLESINLFQRNHTRKYLLKLNIALRNLG